MLVWPLAAESSISWPLLPLVLNDSQSQSHQLASTSSTGNQLHSTSMCAGTAPMPSKASSSPLQSPWRSQAAVGLMALLVRDTGKARTSPPSSRRPLEKPGHHRHPSEDHWRTQDITAILKKMPRAQNQQTAQAHQSSASGCFQLLELPPVTSQATHDHGRSLSAASLLQSSELLSTFFFTSLPFYYFHMHSV